MSKPVVPRTLAVDDLDQACDYYLKSGGSDLVVEFLYEFGDELVFIPKFPETGSPRYGFEPGLAGLRFWRMKKVSSSHLLRRNRA